MLNTNYTFVNPLANQHNDNLAKGVPHQTVNRNISQPIDQNHTISHIIGKLRNYQKRLYVQNYHQAPLVQNHS